MEDKRGIKCEHSPSPEGSPSPSDAKTPPPVPSESPPLSGSTSEISSRRSHSPVFEQGGPSEKASMIDLASSSNEEGLIPDASHDFEFVQQLFGELNRDLLGPPGNDKIIVLSDSDEK
jgi:hypothetical protein